MIPTYLFIGKYAAMKTGESNDAVRLRFPELGAFHLPKALVENLLEASVACEVTEEQFRASLTPSVQP